MLEKKNIKFNPCMIFENIGRTKKQNKVDWDL